MTYKIKVITLLLTLGVSLSALSFACNAKPKNNVTISFEKPRGKDQKQALAYLKSAELESTLDEFINSLFKLNEPLTLTFGGDDGPLYDSEYNEIFIPYDFIVIAKDRFDAISSDDQDSLSSEQATIDAVVHTVVHELAHALIFTEQIPIVGREEDAADSLAAILLIDYFEDGHEMVFSGAELFGLESLDVDEYQEQDLSGEHSLDAQRYYQTLCYIYGSAPDDYKSIIELVDFSDGRAELCEDEYAMALRSWQVLLAPSLKRRLFDSE